MPWGDGDYITPTNLNSKGASATSVAGFSTNTLRPESGSTISALGMFDLRGGGLSLRTFSSAGSSSNLTNGEFCVVAMSGTSAQLAFRSGNTTFLFNAIAVSL